MRAWCLVCVKVGRRGFCENERIRERSAYFFNEFFPVSSGVSALRVLCETIASVDFEGYIREIKFSI